MSDRPTITAFSWVPEFARGHVRDLRLRWALEEVGQPYDVRLLDHQAVKAAEHRSLQPFGQVPTYEQDGIALVRIGRDPAADRAQMARACCRPIRSGAAHAEQWVFAAMNSIEPAVQDMALVNVFEADQPWADQRRPVSEKRMRGRLQDLSNRLGDKQWLEDEFTVGDLLMACVLHGLDGTGLVDGISPILPLMSRAPGRAPPSSGRWPHTWPTSPISRRSRPESG